MRVTVISHSLIAERQKRFFDFFEKLSGWEVQQIYPLDWGKREHREGGFPVIFEGDMRRFYFPAKARIKILEFKPDIVYVQDEFWCTVTEQMYWVAKEAKAKFVVFIWENFLGKYSGREDLIQKTDLIICGNREAERIITALNKKTVVSIQVGVDTELFKPDPTIHKEYDLLFLGRNVEEKGIKVIEKAVEGLTDLRIRWKSREGFTPYLETPRVYNGAKVHLAPSIDVGFWKEQHASYANLEALSCGLRVVTSTSEAIWDNLQKCPGVYFAPMGRHLELRDGILRALEDYRVNIEGRSFVQERFSMEEIGEKLKDVFSFSLP